MIKSHKRYFAGIGSRTCPESFRPLFEKISLFLIKKGFILRSGGAFGADEFWETGYIKAGGEMEIYLPWKGFNLNESQLTYPKEAEKIAAEVHPIFHKLKQGAKRLHSRNICQCLGYDLKTPSEFILCWTEGGVTKGGTATAINLAIKSNIPVFNFGDENTLDKFREFCKNL